MNIKHLILVGVVGTMACAMALDNIEVTGVKARQRYPWNGKVDIDFTLDSKATEPYQMHVEVYDNVGKTNLPVVSVSTEGVSLESNPCMVRTDTSRIVWDAAKDLPNGFKCTNVLVSCQDARLIAASNLYCVINLSDGTKEYMSRVPSGGWTDEYKTTKMAFRRIEAGSFMMGSVATEIGRSSNEDRHKVSLSHPFYLSVFEVTEKQWSMVSGGTSVTEKPVLVTYSAIRGADMSVSYNLSGYASGYSPTANCFPNSTSVDSSSFMGILRSRSGIESVDLPTEAQWEFACRGGCDQGVNNGYPCDADAVNVVGRNGNNTSDGKGDASYTRETVVGSYMPNSLGLYDMLGNAAEWCADAYTNSLGSADVVDPKGGNPLIVARGYRPYENGNSFAESSSGRVIKGGVYYSKVKGTGDSYQHVQTLGYTSCRSAFRSYAIIGLEYSSNSEMCGFRVAFSAE